MKDDLLAIARAFAPRFYFDSREPFFPVAVGVSLFRQAAPSPSFPRAVRLLYGAAAVIEYAVYWDYDIGHLYELEHVWVYFDGENSVVGCECSWHGGYWKGLLVDKSNIQDKRHVVLYSQPGKHAFAPMPDVFHLLPGLYAAAGERAGMGGLLITDVAKGRYEANPEINYLVYRYLREKRFEPSMEFVPWRLEDGLLMPWEELDRSIPARIADRLAELGYSQPSCARVL